MKKLVLILISVFALSSCEKDDDNTTPLVAQEITPTLIYKGIFNPDYNPATQHGEVIDNQNDWDNFRNDQWTQGLTLEEANNIDFSTEMVILAFDKLKSTSGNLTNISGITENQNDITVTIQYLAYGLLQTPGRSCYFVKIPKSAKPVIFEYETINPY